LALCRCVIVTCSGSNVLCEWKGPRSEVGAHETSCAHLKLSSTIGALLGREKEVESKRVLDLTDENYETLVEAGREHLEQDLDYWRKRLKDDPDMTCIYCGLRAYTGHACKVPTVKIIRKCHGCLFSEKTGQEYCTKHYLDRSECRDIDPTFEAETKAKILTAEENLKQWSKRPDFNLCVDDILCHWPYNGST